MPGFDEEEQRRTFAEAVAKGAAAPVEDGVREERESRGAEGVLPGARVQKWADVAMWQAPEHVDPQKPRVTVTMCTPDPLGVMAMVNAQYTGRNLTSPADVTDEERRAAWEAATVSRLSETPLEWIQIGLNFENVTRAFTHQLVRTRLATYAQESQRFAVKEGLARAIKLPPSLAGTKPHRDVVMGLYREGVDPEINLSQEQKWRALWDAAVSEIQNSYALLVDQGMPAEDARGLLPTNVLTRIHMRTDMKTLLNLAGMRLCTQAQFEWRAVFAQLASALRGYGATQDNTNRWQYALTADSFRPVCYAANKCTMKAKSDRACSIRDRVDINERLGRPSSEWETDSHQQGHPGQKVAPSGKPIAVAIHPAEWLADPAAARVAPGAERMGDLPLEADCSVCGAPIVRNRMGSDLEGEYGGVGPVRVSWCHVDPPVGNPHRAEYKPK